MDKIKSLFIKYKDIISYLFFGGVTTVINWGTYTICVSLLDISINISNIIAWFMAVAVAYITNKLFVFHSKEMSFKGLMKEIGLFFIVYRYSFRRTALLRFQFYRHNRPSVC
jgi:putative flippase GtrA